MITTKHEATSSDSVYVAKYRQYVKFGYTSRPIKYRLEELRKQYGTNEIEMVVVYSTPYCGWRCEQDLHYAFRQYRLPYPYFKSSEWYLLPDHLYSHLLHLIDNDRLFDYADQIYHIHWMLEEEHSLAEELARDEFADRID